MTVPSEVSELIKNSGNNFHAKVARWLAENDWHVVVSPYYMDQTQNKAREIDLIAEKFWPINDSFSNQTGVLPFDFILSANLFLHIQFFGLPIKIKNLHWSWFAQTVTTEKTTPTLKHITIWRTAQKLQSCSPRVQVKQMKMSRSIKH